MRMALIVWGIVGFVLLLGTAGAFDTSAIAFELALPRCLFSLAMVLSSFWGVRLYDRMALRRRRALRMEMNHAVSGKVRRHAAA